MDADATLARLARTHHRLSERNAMLLGHATKAHDRMARMAKVLRRRSRKATTAKDRRAINDAYLQACRKRTMMASVIGLLRETGQHVPPLARKG